MKLQPMEPETRTLTLTPLRSKLKADPFADQHPDITPPGLWMCHGSWLGSWQHCPHCDVPPPLVV